MTKPDGREQRSTIAATAGTLPIEDAIPALRAALGATPNVVLEAPPGAGKTTRVPLALLREQWLGTGRVIMLEPRRLAARAAAHYMARLLGERVGDTVGFRVRGETRVGPRTRIEVVTEGILARMLASDTTLEGVGLVIFDEFHERSLHADLGLALTLQTQQLLRPELRVLVMSATLDGDAVSALLSPANGTVTPVVRSAGRMFPVQTHYRPKRADERMESAVVRAIAEAVEHYDGDVLVFLPGAGEQRRVAQRLQGNDVLARANARVYTLHGSMPLAEQEAAIAPAPHEERKVVLATSIAETSLTIEGIRTVVDSGLSRLPRFSPRTGITRLETVRVSRASADQRRGRAGRVAPGVCLRLWDEHEDAMLSPRTRPEILEADLAPLALALADAGVNDPSELLWLDAPPGGAFRHARELLAMLGALDALGRITAHGKIIAALPTHPRLAHLLVHSALHSETKLGAELCALIEERDILRGEYGPPVADLRLRLELLQDASAIAMSASLAGAHVDNDGVRRLRDVARDLRQRLNEGNALAEPRNHAAHFAGDSAGALLALAFPDRVAQKRAGSEPRYLMRSGVGASLPRHDALADAPYLAIADLDGAPPEYGIARAIPLTRDDVLRLFGSQIVRISVVEWDDDARAVRARRRAMLGAIVLDDHAWNNPDTAAVREALLGEIVRAGIDALPLNESAERLRARLAFLHHHDARWPDVSSDTLLRTIGEWLAPELSGVRKWDELARVDTATALLPLLDWEQRAALDRVAPTHLEVPSGSRIQLDYANPDAPVLAVKLQEVFGWTATPRLLDGKVPVTLHLLSPAQRPVQVTQDLAGFWRTSYFDVRKDLRGRYPRHPWPDDPLAATATRRAKPRGT